jgi:hypothetical protein
MSIITDITRETVELVYKEAQKRKNHRKITYIIDLITGLAIRKIQPFIYTIFALLIVLFLMNCFQFYFYVRSMTIPFNELSYVDRN